MGKRGGGAVSPHLEPTSTWLVLERHCRSAEAGEGVGGAVSSDVTS